MIERATRSAPAPAGTASRWRCRWPEWAGYAAAGWSLLYGALGLSWSFGGAGFPFGRGNDPQAALSILEGTRAATGAPVIAGLGLVGAAIAVAMTRGRGRDLRFLRSAQVDLQYANSDLQAFDQRGGSRLENEVTWPNVRLNWSDMPLTGFMRSVIRTMSVTGG